MPIAPNAYAAATAPATSAAIRLDVRVRAHGAGKSTTLSDHEHSRRSNWHLVREVRQAGRAGQPLPPAGQPLPPAGQPLPPAGSGPQFRSVGAVADVQDLTFLVHPGHEVTPAVGHNGLDLAVTPGQRFFQGIPQLI